MSGIVGLSGSKSGLLGYTKGQWKHLYKADGRPAPTGDGGGATLDFHAAHGIVNSTFTQYRLIGVGIQGSAGDVRELGLRWSTQTGATTGYASAGYYGARWSGHHSSSHTSAALSNATQVRVAYLNAPNATFGQTQMIINLSNPGAGDPTNGSVQTGAICHTTGYVHSTSSAGHGGVTSMAINNNAGAATNGTNGEISAISLTLNTGHFNAGTVDLFGLVLV